MIIRPRLVYGLLASIWVALVVWQLVEHERVREREQSSFKNKAGIYSRSASEILRALQRFGGWAMQTRLEPALLSLIKPGDVNSILVLNDDEEVLARAGDPFDPKLLNEEGELWTDSTVAIAALVDLGTNVTSEIPPPRVAPDLPSPATASSTNLMEPHTNAVLPATASDGHREPLATERDQRPREEARGENRTDRTEGRNEGGRNDGQAGRGGRGGRPPRWFTQLASGMTPEEFQAAVRRRGVHSFVFVFPTDKMRAAVTYDFWMRSLITLLGSVAVVGLGLAWRNLTLTSELEVRLVRASELNARLKEMNLAAAGLAHETRNPLNIIRGLAQMISKQQDTSPEVRSKTREILDEADRVTAQLNEFINYSRPREVRRTAVPVGSVVGEVVRALNFDIEEKVLRVEVQPNLPTISADEQLLRQALFNLLLNATQAVERGGEIHVAAHRVNGNEVVLEIRDNGPGVAVEQRKEIFKPYFTTNQKGTGLGLAVVQQIVLAHGWDIECSGNDPRGAVFRISHIRPATPA